MLMGQDRQEMDSRGARSYVTRRSAHSVNESKTVSPEQTPDTTRRRLNRIRRVTAFFIVTGSLSFFASFPCFFFAPGVACGLMAVCAAFNPIGLVIRALAGRCGHCHRRLSRALSFGGWPWSISPDVHFCPYCAASIDEPLAQIRNA